MEKYHYLTAKTPYSLDSLLPFELIDEIYALNMAIVERDGIETLPEEWKASQGIYILLSHIQPGYRFEAYVGQTLAGFQKRLARHGKEREFWDIAILAKRTNDLGLNSLQLNSIEGKLRDALVQAPNTHVHNDYPTGDQTMRSSDSQLVDEIALSIMRTMTIRGYRCQPLGVEDKPQNHTTVSSSPKMASPIDNVYNDSTDNVIKAGIEAQVGHVAMTHSGSGKLEELKAWRCNQALIEGRSKQPYLIFDNKTLERIAMATPKTHDDLLSIAGIGPNKLEKYGHELLRIMGEV